MHPRNRYRDIKPDFEAYANTRPSLAPHLRQRKNPSAEGFLCTLDFSDPDALRELTCACLEHDFNLRVTIPLGHLIPTVPQKLNYIHWLEDLLGIDDSSNRLSGPAQIHGIDVGGWSVCFYDHTHPSNNLCTDVLCSIYLQQPKYEEHFSTSVIGTNYGGSTRACMRLLKQNIHHGMCSLGLEKCSSYLGLGFG